MEKFNAFVIATCASFLPGLFNVTLVTNIVLGTVIYILVYYKVLNYMKEN